MTPTPILRWLAALVLAAAMLSAHAAEFTVRRADITVVNEVYTVVAEFNLDLSEESREALDHGVYLTVAVEMEIRRERSVIWDALMARSVRRFRLQHHALTQQYIVTDTSSGISSNFPSLATAIAAIASPSPMPVARRDSLPNDEFYHARVRARLDNDALPAPLRPIAIFKSGWRQKSPWYRIEMPR